MACLYIWHSNALPFGIQHCSTNLRCHGIFSLSSAVGRRLVYALWVRERSWCAMKKALIPGAMKATSASLDVITDALTSWDISNSEKKWKHSIYSTMVSWDQAQQHHQRCKKKSGSLYWPILDVHTTHPGRSLLNPHCSTLLAGAGSACPYRIALQLHAATHSSEALEPWGGATEGEAFPHKLGRF